LAFKHKCMLIIDDDSAKAYASIFNIESHGTLFVIYLARIKGFINSKDAIGILEDMIANGFYVSPEIYARFFDLLNSLKS